MVYQGIDLHENERMKIGEMSFLSYANSFQAKPKLELNRMFCLLSHLNNPQNYGRFIHIAGTNGKGSVAMGSASVLTAAGFRCGLFISPNLIRVNERISVDGVPISDEALTALMKKVEVAAHQTEKQMDELPTQFEIWTACAFLYFRETECDYTVLETGLGGEFDATNTILHNEIAILTHIDYDHTQMLGHTISEIARTKCGILKPDAGSGKVICAPQLPEAEAVIRRCAAANGLSPIFITPPAPSSHSGFYEIIDDGALQNLRLPFAGAFQIENICLVIESMRTLGISDKAISIGLKKAKHPARMELLRECPPMIYDGGHNPNGIDALTASLERYAPDTKWAVIFAAMRDKDILPSLLRLLPHAKRFLFTTVQNNPRALTPGELVKKAHGTGVEGTAFACLSDAISDALHEPTLICGSLYLYADVPSNFRSI